MTTRFTPDILKQKGYFFQNGVGKKLAPIVTGVRCVTQKDLDNMGKKPKKKRVKTYSKEKIFIEFALIATKIEYVKEFRFDKVRRWRFDYAILEKMLYVEYDGIFSDRSRHTSLTGFVGDCEKLNCAAVNGWRGLRYTAKNYTDIVEDLKKILK